MSKKAAYLLFFFTLGTGLTRSSALAAANPMVVESPAPVHRFLDGRNIGLQSISMVMLAADVATTRRALQVPGSRELNPLAQSRGSMLALKAAGVGAGIGIAYLMHRSGHHKAERLVPLIFGAPSGIAAVHNAGIHR